MIVAKYKFNPSTYENYLPEFNSEFTDYTTSDVNNSDGTITRTIESNSLPTRMQFGNGWVNNDYDNEQQPRRDSLLEVISADMSSIKSVTAMFRGCSNVTSVNLSNVSSTTVDMSVMFENCSSLASLDTSNWNTSNVFNMVYMFRGCSKLTSLDVSNWNTSKVTNISNMFLNCSSLTTLDVSKWNTSQVTNMQGVFNGCSSLTSLDLNNWDTSQVTKMDTMFLNCSSLTTLDVSKWNTSQVTNMQGVFNGCSSLTSLDLNNWDTSQVTKMDTMFLNCSSLTTLDVSKWNTSNVTNMHSTFSSCSSLTTLDVSNWDTSKVISMNYLFQSCSKLTTLDVSNWNTSNVTNMSNMFTNCPSLRKIKLVNAIIPQLVKVLPIRASSSLGYLFSPTLIPNEKNWNTIISYTGYNITIKSPIPLRKLGDIKDRLYFDNEKGYYCIEQNVGKVVLDGSEDEDWNISESSSIDRINTTAFRLSDPMIGSVYNIKCDKFITCSRENNCYDTDNEGVVGIGGEPYYLCLGIKKSKLPTQDVAGFRQWLQTNPTTVLYQLETPIIIEFPELTNQPRLYQKEDTTINISTDNIEPSKIAIEYNDINNN